jgi:hypothetical protein
MKTVLALVLGTQVIATPDQPWSLETVVDLETASGPLQVRLPGGSRDGVTVTVSHTPPLHPGGRYALEVLEVEGVWRVGAATVVDPVPSPPYVLAGSTWGAGVVPVDFFLSGGSFPGHMDPDALEAAYTEVLRIWNRDGRARVALSYGGLTSNTQYGSGSDGSNTTKYQSSTWGSTLAVSVRTVVGSEIRDCDIRFYGANSNGSIDWNLDPLGAPNGENAFRHTLVHELGHCLGISHSEYPDALMYAYAPDEQGPASWALHEDDVAALQAIYGEAVPALAMSEADFGGEAVRATVTNTGDWTAFDVEAEAMLTGTWSALEAAGLGDLEAGESIDLRIPHSGESCGSGEALLAIADAFEASDSAEVTRSVLCDEPGAGSGSAESPAVGCGCTFQGSSALGWWWLVLPGLASWRRR